jgi:hypothetical protein
VRYDRTILAYHGCDLEVARRLLEGEPFRQSENDYDWLGRGIYFWEYGADRALRFAEDQKRRGRIETPVIVGALVQLGQCFDLMDTEYTGRLERFFPVWAAELAARGVELPANEGRTPELKLRRLDCAVINAYMDFAREAGQEYDTVRCGFVEGGKIYSGAGIHRQSHVQLAVRNQRCILGVFWPYAPQGGTP